MSTIMDGSYARARHAAQLSRWKKTDALADLKVYGNSSCTRAPEGQPSPTRMRTVGGGTRPALLPNAHELAVKGDPPRTWTSSTCHARGARLLVGV